MERKQIEFRQLCALVRSVIQRDPTIPDSEWKARTLDTLVKWGFAYPSDHGMINRAMTQVEFAVRKTLGPRPQSPLVATPPSVSKLAPSEYREARTHHPAGWDVVMRLMATLQTASAASGPASPPPPADTLPLTEVQAVNEFWRASQEKGTDRLALLRAFAEIAIVRSIDWDPAAIREHAGEHRLFSNGCFACGRADSCAWHHIIQVQHGGSNYVRNRVSLCEGCHAAVHPWLPGIPRTLRGEWTRIGDIAAVVLERVKEAAS